MERAAADFIVIGTPPEASRPSFTPEGLSDDVASTLPVAGAAAAAALAAIDIGSHDTVLIGGRPAVWACSPCNWPSSPAQR